jgi:hypothetical protein
MRSHDETVLMSERDHCVISDRSWQGSTDRGRAADLQGLSVGMPGFEPGFSGPPGR